MINCRVLRLAARKQEPSKAIKAAIIVVIKRILGSVSPNHSMATNTGISNDTTPKSGKKSIIPERPKVARIMPNIVALRDEVMHNCSQLNVTQ